MPEFSLKDSIITSLNAQEPWPDNVKLFQPYEVEQILLPDNASCLAVQAFLKMCNLPFDVEMRWNAEFMSPSGRVPFIKCGAFVVSELEPIVQFAANKGVSLCSKLSTEEKAEMRAYMSLITNVLVNAELYISWLDDDTFNAVTKIRNSSVYPWPLGWLQTRSKRNTVSKRLKALHWQDKSLEQVLADVEQCCNSLSQRLGDKDFFFGTPTALDALVYGHVRALLSAAGPKAALMIKPITSSMLRHVLCMNNLTRMRLTPQEEYLISQAMQISRRKLSPTRTISERSARTRRSKLSVRNISKENIARRDVFGFKPFASKQIIMMTSNEGRITCQYDGQIQDHRLEDRIFMIDIIEDIIDRVNEFTLETNDIFEIEKSDFEIVHPKKESEYDTIDKINDFLDTIDEDELNDTTVSLESNDEDVIQIINTYEDSDGLINEKLLTPISDVEERIQKCYGSQLTDSSNNKRELNEAYVTVTSSGDRLSVRNFTESSALSSGSKCTLKMPSDEDISIESLLHYLRKKNAERYSHEIADID